MGKQRRNGDFTEPAVVPSRPMRPAPWTSLVRTLADAGHQSPYLDRLRARVDPSRAQDDLETEIRAEIAAALGRAEDKVNAALLRLELAGRDLDTAADGDRRQRTADFNALREEALHARWELLVHREAVGFRRNGMLDELYPIPPRR
jgi:hypothetical protein